uniref:Uncharacterized protein n=1 Tax=Spiroplasma citri TaxID=2133 RepID=Q14L90_SPICI|nr:hypothetical protein SPICI19_090 [Spiroplasma citri]
MEVKLIEELYKENRIKYEKNKGYKLCDNGYIFHSIKNYLKVVGCFNNFRKSKVSYISFSCKNKIKFLCKKFYKSFKKESNYVLSIYDEQSYKKPIQINIKDFNYEIEYQWIW